jgi:hypothetical protein
MNFSVHVEKPFHPVGLFLRVLYSATFRPASGATSATMNDFDPVCNVGFVCGIVNRLGRLLM